MTKLEVLQKARSIIAPREKWTRGWGHGRDGSATTCAVGALRVAVGLNTRSCSCPQCISDVERDEFQGALLALAAPLGLNEETLGDAEAGVISYNDSHDHACVLAAFDAAIASCEATN